MAIRTAQEIIGSVKGILGEQAPEGLENLLEDITDSVQAPDMSAYVAKEDYDKVITERDGYKTSAEDMRARYINRFYSDYQAPNDKGIIEGAAMQSKIESKEKIDHYGDLFE